MNEEKEIETFKSLLFDVIDHYQLDIGISKAIIANVINYLKELNYFDDD